jgi:hypothetical protein
VRIAAISSLVCVASWIGLLIGAGNVGLQRSVAIGPLTLLEQPLALGLAAVLAFLAAWLPALLSPTSAFSPRSLVGGVVAGDLIGAVILAPVVVGELEVIHAPVVFAAITALGLQPLAAFLGARLAGARDRRA